jgi:Fe2+ transport system protein FeoA
MMARGKDAKRTPLSKIAKTMAKPTCPLVAVDLRCVAVKKRVPPYQVLEGQCAGPAVCPLSRVKAGTTVCIKELVASPELRDRLRELGLGEEQRIKLLSGEANVICQVCNARLALSEKLAKAILVEPVPADA